MPSPQVQDRSYAFVEFRSVEVRARQLCSAVRCRAAAHPPPPCFWHTHNTGAPLTHDEQEASNAMALDGVLFRENYIKARGGAWVAGR